MNDYSENPTRILVLALRNWNKDSTPVSTS